MLNDYEQRTASLQIDRNDAWPDSRSLFCGKQSRWIPFYHSSCGPVATLSRHRMSYDGYVSMHLGIDKPQNLILEGDGKRSSDECVYSVLMASLCSTYWVANHLGGWTYCAGRASLYLGQHRTPDT